MASIVTKPTASKAGPINQHKRLAMGKPVPKAKPPKGLERI